MKDGDKQAIIKNFILIKIVLLILQTPLNPLNIE